MQFVTVRSASRTSSAGSPRLQFGSVAFDEDGAAELDGRRRLVSVPKAEITGVELAYAHGVSNPLLVGLVGAAVLVMAILVPALSLVNIGIHPQTRFAMVWAIRAWYVAPFVLPGGWLVILALRKRWVIRVHTTRGIRPLIIRGTDDVSAMREFVSAVCGLFGYPQIR